MNYKAKVSFNKVHKLKAGPVAMRSIKDKILLAKEEMINSNRQLKKWYGK